MKRIFLAVFLSLTVLINIVPAFTEEISENQAKTLAQQYLYGFSWMTEADCRTYELAEIYSDVSVDGSPVWKAHFFGDRNDPRFSTNAYILSISKKTGELVDTYYPTVRNPVQSEFRKLRDEYHSEYFVHWTIQQKYDFHQRFPSLLEEFRHMLPPEGAQYEPISDHLTELINTDYRLPDDSCITQDKATQIADQALIASDNQISSEVLGYHQHAWSFLYSYDFSNQGCLVWKVFYIPDRMYITDHKDCGYYVEIDARTGVLYGIRHQVQDPLTNPWAIEYE